MTVSCNICGEEMKKVYTTDFEGFFVCYHNGEFIMTYFDETEGYLESITASEP